MNCPRCKQPMDGQRSDFVISTGAPPGTGRMMPQWHYRCEDCDVEYVRTGWSGRLRVIDSADPGPPATIQ